MTPRQPGPCGPGCEPQCPNCGTPTGKPGPCETCGGAGKIDLLHEASGARIWGYPCPDCPKHGAQAVADTCLNTAIDKATLDQGYFKPGYAPQADAGWCCAGEDGMHMGDCRWRCQECGHMDCRDHQPTPDAAPDRPCRACGKPISEDVHTAECLDRGIELEAEALQAKAREWAEREPFALMYNTETLVAVRLQAYLAGARREERHE